MAHQIEELDLTFSTTGTEWHGLAVVEPDPVKLLEIVKSNCCFPIIQSDAVVCIEGKQVPLKDMETGKGWKVILADCRNLPVHPARREHPADFVPLHVPKTSYNEMENLRFLECLEKAMSNLGLPFNLSTAGTLSNLAMFYFSIDLGVEIKGGRGEPLKPYLSGVTSHNGFYAPTFKDSITRPVCANTVGGLMRELSSLTITGKHTANGLESIENMGKAVEAFFQGVDTLQKDIFPRLQSEELDSIAMREVSAGYFLLPALAGDSKVNLDKLKLSTRAQNAIEGIVDLARTGKGNQGQTAYDLFNGATDYWSNGDGVGKDTVGLSKRAYRSNFGSAASHKSAFCDYLFNPEAVAKGREVGRKVLHNVMMAG